MMFRRVNKQPGIKKSLEINAVTLYLQNIYDWISPLNKQSGSQLIIPQQSMGENEYGISGHLHIFAFFEALNNAFKVQFFQGFIFTSYHRHW